MEKRFEDGLERFEQRLNAMTDTEFYDMLIEDGFIIESMDKSFKFQIKLDEKGTKQIKYNTRVTKEKSLTKNRDCTWVSNVFDIPEVA